MAIAVESPVIHPRIIKCGEDGCWTLVAHIPGKGCETVEWWTEWCDPNRPPDVEGWGYGLDVWHRGYGFDEMGLVFCRNSMLAWRIYRQDYRERHPRSKVA